MRRLGLFAALLLACAASCATASVPAHPLAATPFFRHYNIDQGLPNSFVYTVAQDHQGAIWVGTISGLARFDGTHFTTYRHIPDDPSSIGSDDISCLLVDGTGRVWAGGGGSGINLYQPDTDSFGHFKHDPARADSLSGDDVMALAEGPDGTLWVGVYGHGLDHMVAPGHFQHLTHDPHDPRSLVSNNIWSLFSRGDGRVWIGTDAGMDVLDADGSLRHVHFRGLDRAPVVWGIDGDADQIRAATSKGLFVIGDDATATRLAPDASRDVSVFSSVRDQHGDIWMGTSAGLYLIDDNGTSHFPGQPLIPGGQPGNLIYKVMLDREGGLWLATRNGGLAYLRPDWRDFSHYLHIRGNADTLSYNHVMDVVPDGHGSLWVVGGRGQMDKLDPATGKVTHFGASKGLAKRRILSMASAGQQGLWIGGKALGLLTHGDYRTIFNAASQSTSFPRMVSDAHGNLYAATFNAGVYHVDRQTLQVQRLEPAFNDDADRSTATLLMHDGQLWRANDAGVSYLPSGSLKLMPVPGISKGEASVMTISGHDLWLVRPNGLEHYRLDHQHATLLRRIDAAAGWPGIVAYSMMVDDRGRVWLFAAAGLWRYDPATNHFRHYGKNDGFPSPVFTTKQLARMGTDTVFAGTMNGVIGFHPAQVTDHLRKPLLHITSIVVRRDGHDIQLPADTRHLQLRWDDRDLRVTAHALSYIAPKHNHYRFKLVGFDPDWVDTGTRGTRELAGLADGHYVLKVQAAGPSGAWSSLATPLSIDMAAPPWQRPWAWALYVLVVLVTGYALFAAWRRRLEQRHRVQLAEQQRHMAEQANAAKSRFLANLSHEIRTPMTGVLGMAELLENTADTRQRSCAEAIRHSGELLLNLVNDALDMARIEAGRFELEPGPMNPRDMLSETRQLLSGLARKKQLELSAETDADVPACLRGDALRIKQILLNLANNAIKFTSDGGVYLRAQWHAGELIVHVRDTGPGISPRDRERLFGRFEQADTPERDSGSGLGLAICRELVALMHGRITLESAPGKGSHFKVYLPLPEMAVTTEPEPPAPAASTSSRRVLLVEDDTTIARVICGLLEARGHRVMHAAHSLEALSALDDNDFDLMLLDLDLPGMNGYQLASMIRQRDAGSDLPIAAITARSGGDEEARALDAGMNAFARKPLTGEQLAALITKLCPEP